MYSYSTYTRTWSWSDQYFQLTTGNAIVLPKLNPDPRMNGCDTLPYWMQLKSIWSDSDSQGVVGEYCQLLIVWRSLIIWPLWWSIIYFICMEFSEATKIALWNCDRVSTERVVKTTSSEVNSISNSETELRGGQCTISSAIHPSYCSSNEIVCLFSSATY